jgi:hypothetical protein
MGTGLSPFGRPRWLAGPHEPASYAFSSWLFLRLLGFVYLCAFWSLASQIRGLVGHDGILPADSFMAAIGRAADAQGYSAIGRAFAMPTLCWWSATDHVLVGLTVGGVIVSLALLAGVASVVALPLLWIAYLSLTLVGGDFLSFQWDALLLETGFLAIFLAPLTLVDRPGDHEPRALSRWLLWWLLFRLTLGSGIVKLTSGDPTWRGLTALAFHYETQPLPTPPAWYAFQLPGTVHEISTAATLFIELAVPWCIFGPRLLRRGACYVLVVLQVLIALTGNYAFFNLLTIALALCLLDDAAFARLRRRSAAPSAARWPLPVVAMAALLTVPVSVTILTGQARVPIGSAIAAPLYSVVEPFRLVNGYGLFAVMTTTRSELVVEGSADGVAWLPYEFKYKPGRVDRRLAWVAPHQPRLDWQMWFAALGSYEQDAWVEAFCRRVLEGSPPVLELLASNPFAGKPPALLRVLRYDYRFTNRETRRRTGAVWARTLVGPYSPVLKSE